MANEITPATRWEKLLSEVLGEDYAVIPVTRIEKFLANILGAEYDLIPATRIEKFLAKIAEEGGVGGGYTANDWLDPTKPEGAVESELVMSSGNYLTLAGRTNITRISMPNTEWIPGGFARNCTGVTSINFPKLKSSQGGQFIFAGMVSLEYAVLPAFENDANGQLFANCQSLKAVDYGGDANGTIHRLSTYSFTDCTQLKTIILRSSDMWALQNVDVLRRSPFASNGSGGTLYVPQALIASYQAAANWSTLLGYANNQILPIEGSIYETQYADGTPIT